MEFISSGNGAGIIALDKAVRMIRTKESGCCLVGAIESYIDSETIAWLESQGRLHGAGLFNNAWGFVPGEAGGFCVVVSEDTVEKESIVPDAEVLDISIMIEEGIDNQDGQYTGEAMTLAMRKILESPERENEKIGYIICDMNGEIWRAREYGLAISRLNTFFSDPSTFIAPADCWGDVGAASGALFIGLASSAWKRGYAEGPMALIITSSYGGEKACALLKDATKNH